MAKKWQRHPAVFRIVGWALAQYLRFAYFTSRFSTYPDKADQKVWDNWPCIIVFWHGEHFLVPLVRDRRYSASTLISRHGDGEINAQAAKRFDLNVIRGSGDHKRKGHTKGGLVAFRELVRVLQGGSGVALTADVPKISRRAGVGIIMLARETGRPIVPIAVATSRRVRMNNWDKAAFNLPFSKGVLVVEDFVHVAPDADDDALEAARQTVEDRINAATEKAYEIVDGKDG